MSESETSETRGRCRVEMDAFHGGLQMSVLADGLDRLAADVAEVNRSVREELDGIAADVQAMNPSVRKELDRIAADVAAIKARGDEKLEAVIRERDNAKKNTEALAGVLCGQDFLRSEAEAQRDKARAEVERLRAELAARPAAAGWLTEVERRILAAHVKSLREQRFAMERGGLSVGYSMNPGALKHEADAIDAILARAGSPPVVEVPVMHAGGIHEVIHSQYRAALDKAGVQWKEVPRE